MIEPGSQQHAGNRAGCGKGNLPRRGALVGKREHPAEEDEAHDAKAHGDQAKAHCAGHTQAQPCHHLPQPAIEIHACLRSVFSATSGFM